MKAKYKKGKLIRLESSHGHLMCDHKGYVIEEKSDLSDWLTLVERIDLEEYHEFLSRIRFVFYDEPQYSIDPLEVGYWDKNGKWYPPSHVFRKQIYAGIGNQHVESESQHG